MLSGYVDGSCKPIFCQGTQIGLVRPEVSKELERFPEVFRFSANRKQIRVAEELDTAEKRTEAVDKCLRKLRSDCDFVALRGWRDEFYDIKTNFGGSTLLKMERSATCTLRNFGRVRFPGLLRYFFLQACLVSGNTGLISTGM